MKTIALSVLLAVVCVAADAGEALPGEAPPMVGDHIKIPPETEYSELKLLGRVMQIIHGHFISPSVKHTVLHGVVIDPEEAEDSRRASTTFYKFEDGPIATFNDVRHDEIGICQHPKTKLAYLVDYRHSGGNIDGNYGYVNFIGVNPQTHEMEVAYEEYAIHGPYDQEICGWPAKREKLSIFSDAMLEFRIDIDSDSTYAPVGALDSGETMQLPFRVIPAKTVRAWLEKLSALSAAVVFIDDRIHPALVKIEHAHSGGWHIIQITGRKLCSEYGRGVVLTKHASWKDWRAIYNVEAGCSKALNYPLIIGDRGEGPGDEWIVEIENNMLPVTMYHEFSGRGDSRNVVIDLHTNVIAAE